MRVPVVVASLGVLVLAGGAMVLLVRPSGSPSPPGDEPGPVAAAPVEPAAPAAEPAPEPEPGPAPTRAEPAPTPVAPESEPEPPAPVTATLRIESDVPGASVFLDRVGRGTTPLTIADIEPGPHRLNVSAPGYDGYAEDLDLVPGERTITVAFREIRLDARLAVVHKHGFGSCRGVLTASPAGIRFAAEDGDDSFSVALPDLETFDVDYLGGNLRIKARGGRTYNFADPDDDADRLFVFHRDVDAVRQRLAER